MAVFIVTATAELGSSCCEQKVDQWHRLQAMTLSFVVFVTKREILCAR